MRLVQRPGHKKRHTQTQRTQSRQHTHTHTPMSRATARRLCLCLCLILSFIHSFITYNQSFRSDTQHARHVHALCHLDHHTAVCFKDVLHAFAPFLLCCFRRRLVRHPRYGMSTGSARVLPSVSVRDVLWENTLRVLPSPLGRALHDAELDDPLVLGEFPKRNRKDLESALCLVHRADGIDAPLGATSFSSGCTTQVHCARGQGEEWLFGSHGTMSVVGLGDSPRKGRLATRTASVFPLTVASVPAPEDREGFSNVAGSDAPRRLFVLRKVTSKSMNCRQC